MKFLNKHILKYESALKFLQESLDEVNALSDELLSAIDFSHGQFYTLLPQNAHSEFLYDFRSGGILVQNPIQEYYVDGKKSSFSVIPTIRDQIASELITKIHEKEKAAFLFDDVNCSPEEMLLFDDYQQYRWIYNDEVYLIIDKNNASEEKILLGMQKSESFWHSLCVLSNINITDGSEKTLSFEQIKSICQQAYLIMIGAYDGEGYVFWEKA
ncbi:MAG: hypothetical protein JSR93_01290 [Verrucomicrobia bacterium]|nr:hypothetical protein [Verrucomicrobiota bacterium]